MKKLLLFAIIMSMTLTFAQSKQIDKVLDNSEKGVSTVYNDGKYAVTTVYSDAKSLSPKIESAIKSLANELKTTTNSLWNILVKQQLVWSICFLILTLSALFNWYLFYKRTQSIAKNITWITLTRDMIGDVINPRYDSYYKDRKDDVRGKMFINGIIGKEEYSYPQNPNNIETTKIQDIFKYLHLTICIGLSGLSVYHFGDMLTGFINPEYGALKTIVTVAQSLK